MEQNQNNVAVADAALTAADAARMEQQQFRDGAAYLNSIAADKKRRVLLTVLAVLAGENLKTVKDEYKERFKDLRRDYSGKTDTPAYLERVAELEAAVVEVTIRDTIAGLAETFETISAEIPDTAAAVERCLDNPRQTIADGVKRIDFACRHLSLTADSRKATAARVDALSMRWAADKAKATRDAGPLPEGR